MTTASVIEPMWSKPRTDRRRAVAYVRMSSDQQELSIGTQLQAIERYAEQQNLEIVRVYEDAAKSGLQISNRSGMKDLLRDVMDEPRAFDVVLVNDVSRWGRFQDSDAAAYYEYTCRLHGAEVVYVSEPFGHHLDPMTALLKAMKRTMAAEYARELGVKCRDGQDRAVHLGFQMGSLPCIGFRRVAVSKEGETRLLQRKQRKSMQSERIQWVHGPQEELELVRRIFRLYVTPGASIPTVVSILQAEGVRTPQGGAYTQSIIHALLRCEAFAGHFVWGRERYKAGKLERKRAAVRAPSTLEPVVEATLWKEAQDKLWFRRRLRRDKEELLKALRDSLARHPGLTTLDLEAMGLPSRRAYANAFGSVSRALALAGRDPKVVRAIHERRKVLGRKVGDQVQRDVAAQVRLGGIPCRVHPRSRLMILEGGLRVRMQFVWPRVIDGVCHWHTFKRDVPASHYVLLALMDEGPVVKEFHLQSVELYKRRPKWIKSDPSQGVSVIKNGQELIEGIRRVRTEYLAIPSA